MRSFPGAQFLESCRAVRPHYKPRRRNVAKAVNRTLLFLNLVVLLPLDRGWHHSCTQAAA